MTKLALNQTGVLSNHVSLTNMAYPLGTRYFATGDVATGARVFGSRISV